MRQHPVLVVPLIFVFPVAAWLVGTFKTERTYVALPLRSVPQGISAFKIDVVPTIVIRQGSAIVAFVDGVPPRDSLVVCRGRFVDARTGARWDLGGRALAGTHRDLDRVTTKIVGTKLRLFPQQIVSPDGDRPPPFIPVLGKGWEAAALAPTNC